jgi:hypothetical protein
MSPGVEEVATRHSQLGSQPSFPGSHHCRGNVDRSLMHARGLAIGEGFRGKGINVHRTWTLDSFSVLGLTTFKLAPQLAHIVRTSTRNRQALVKASIVNRGGDGLIA